MRTEASSSDTAAPVVVRPILMVPVDGGLGIPGGLPQRVLDVLSGRQMIADRHVEQRSVYGACVHPVDNKLGFAPVRLSVAVLRVRLSRPGE